MKRASGVKRVLRGVAGMNREFDSRVLARPMSLYFATLAYYWYILFYYFVPLNLKLYTRTVF